MNQHGKVPKNTLDWENPVANCYKYCDYITTFKNTQNNIIEFYGYHKMQYTSMLNFG